MNIDLSDDDKDRGTGRTTRLALAYCEKCMERAGQWTPVEDHWNTMTAHRRLAKMVSEILTVLNVPHEIINATIKVEPRP